MDSTVLDISPIANSARNAAGRAEKLTRKARADVCQNLSNDLDEIDQGLKQSFTGSGSSFGIIAAKLADNQKPTAKIFRNLFNTLDKLFEADRLTSPGALREELKMLTHKVQAIIHTTIARAGASYTRFTRALSQLINTSKKIEYKDKLIDMFDLPHI